MAEKTNQPICPDRISCRFYYFFQNFTLHCDYILLFLNGKVRFDMLFLCTRSQKYRKNVYNNTNSYGKSFVDMSVRPHFCQEPQRHRDSRTRSRGLRTRDSQATTNHHKPPLFSVSSNLLPPISLFFMSRENGTDTLEY
jgi:hypothetical protein